VQALQKVAVKSHGKDSLEASLENRYRGCGSDMLGQTVPSMGTSNNKCNKEGPSKAQK